MPLNLSETPQEREERLAKQRKKRVVLIAGILGLALFLRLVISDPPKPAPPDYSNTPIRYLPGMYDAMDEETRSRLTPEQVAKFKEADRLAAEGRWKEEPADQPVEYVPQAPVEAIQEDLEAYREELFVYELKRKRIEEKKRELLLAAEVVRGTLVHFRNGSHTKARSAERERSKVLINYDRGLKLTLPSGTVRRIVEDAENWEAPIPRGYVKLTPAKGATLILRKNVAKRVTYENKSPYDEFL